MPTNRDQEDVRENVEDVVAESGAGAEKGEGDLDLEGLDLTVETVEERISPSETNVFDK